MGSKVTTECGLFGNEQVVVASERGEVTHPKSGKVMPPTVLGAEQPIDPKIERRRALADWLATADNPYLRGISSTAT